MDRLYEVFWTRTDVPADSSILSPDEITRASRFRFEADRLRWIAARCLLRRAIGERTGISPRDVRFGYTRYGKPYVPGWDTKFNLSHSGDVAVCVIGGHDDIGIDVEMIRPLEAIESVFKAIASRAEFTLFRSLPARSQLTLFFATWTIKEACVKATGLGLTQPLSEIDLLPHGRAEIAGSLRWSVCMFTPTAGYTAAVAVAPADSRPIGVRVRWCDGLAGQRLTLNGSRALGQP